MGPWRSCSELDQVFSSANKRLASQVKETFGVKTTVVISHPDCTTLEN